MTASVLSLIHIYKAAVKSKLGVVFQNSVLDKALTVFDNLCSRAALYGITGTAFRKRLDALDGLLELKPLLRRPVGKLSGGQRRRADIARALLHEPSILILDEPTTGLDPQTRAVVWQVITRLRKEQGTVSYTHLDVYKRQGCQKQCCTAAENQVHHRLRDLGSEDVYKRQV